MDPTEFTRKDTVYSYIPFMDASNFFLKQAPFEKKDPDFNIMASIIFCAFALESFLNCMGKIKLKGWEILENSNLNPKQKLDFLIQDFSDKIDFGKRPFQNFKPIFKFRNLLAHAKMESFEETESLDDSITDWEKYCTIENAEKFCNDTKDMIYKLIEYAGLPEWLKFTFKMGHLRAGSNNNHAIDR